MTPTRAAWIFLILLTAVRFVMIGQMELAPDEAYYHLWSQNLDWWYFSKGPGVALMMKAGTSLFGHGEFGIRFFSPILALGTSLILFALATRMYSDRVAFWTVVTINVVPIFNAGGLVMTIDPISIFFWTAALYTVWRALEKRGRFSLWWPATGALIGCGWLAKMTNAAELASIALLVFFTPRYRIELRRPGFWVMLLSFVPFLVPFWIWQSSHGWPTTTHLVARGGLEKEWYAIEGQSFLKWLGVHFAIYSPLVFAGMIIAGFAAAQGSISRWVDAILECFGKFPDGMGKILKRLRARLFLWTGVLALSVLSLIWGAVYDNYPMLVVGGFVGFVSILVCGYSHQLLIVGLLCLTGLITNTPAVYKMAFAYGLLALLMWVHAQKERSNMHSKARFLLAFAAPLFVGYAWIALHHDSEPNWTAPAVVSLTLLAVAFWEELAERHKGAARFAVVALILSSLLTILALDPELVRRAGAKWPYKRDHTARLRGWREAARKVSEFRAEYEKQTGNKVILIANHYATASALAHYLPDPRFEVKGHPAIYVEESPVAENQYHFWGRYDEFQLRDPNKPLDIVTENSEEGACLFTGGNALYVTDRNEDTPPSVIKQTFAKWEMLAIYDQTRRGLPLRQIRIFLCQTYKPLSL